ncbi:hypothetical protein [Flavobacterium sp.]|jgi:hypothetical protein|uniref:hypothetical protein n=1 Tax=Flavobacterium sp. TaxID=239 RepID=UPI0037C1056B
MRRFLTLLTLSFVVSCSRNDKVVGRLSEILGVDIVNYTYFRNEKSSSFGSNSIVVQIKIERADFVSLFKNVKDIDKFKKQGSIYYLNMEMTNQRESVIIDTSNETITYSFIDR